jgi:hypothetical protein
MHHRDRTLCLQSSIVIVSVLAISRGLCGHFSRRWDMASPRSSLEPQGYFMGTRTYGVYVW